MLGPRDRQCFEQAVQEPIIESQTHAARIWMVEMRNDADVAFDAFVETYAVKYEKPSMPE